MQLNDWHYPFLEGVAVFVVALALEVLGVVVFLAVTFLAGAAFFGALASFLSAVAFLVDFSSFSSSFNKSALIRMLNH